LSLKTGEKTAATRQSAALRRKKAGFASFLQLRNKWEQHCFTPNPPPSRYPRPKKASLFPFNEKRRFQPPSAKKTPFACMQKEKTDSDAPSGKKSSSASLKKKRL